MRSSITKLAAGAMAAALVAYSAAICSAQARAPVAPNPPVVAPQPAPPSVSTQAPQSVTANKLSIPGPTLGRGSDAEIATLLAIANQEEVAMAHLAAAKIQNADVRSFADMMVHDHTEFLQQLAKFGGYSGFSGLEPANVPTSPTGIQNLPGTSATQSQPLAQAQPTSQPALPAAVAGQQPVATNAARPMRSFDIVAAKRQIAEACLRMSQKDLESKKPFEAEMDYVGTQIVAHQDMLETMKVFRQYASADFQPVLDKGIQTTETHLDKAKTLVKELARAHHEGTSTSADR